MYITDCCFGLKPNCSLITSAIFVSNQLMFQHLAFVGEKPRSLHWSSLQVAELHDSLAVEPIASVVLAELSDWVSAKSSSAVELMD